MSVGLKSSFLKNILSALIKAGYYKRNIHSFALITHSVSGLFLYSDMLPALFSEDKVLVCCTYFTGMLGNCSI